MSGPPTPSEIFDRAVDEGERRLDQSLLELASTSFIAGFTVVFGVVALGIVESMVEPRFGEVATIAGALAFAIGFVFLEIGRTELFNENFSDPTAAAVDSSDVSMVLPLLRLWVVTLVVNLVGGLLFALVFSIPGVLPPGAAAALKAFALDSAGRTPLDWFASGIAGGALVSLLSFLVVAVDGDSSRAGLTYAVGFLLALGPFSHVVVTMLHVFLGVLFGAEIGLVTIALMLVVIIAGNFVGGLGLVTFTHVTQAIGQNDSE